MKKIISVVVAVCVSLAISAATVLASDNMSAKYDLSSNSIFVSGSFSVASNDRLASIAVFKYGDTIGNSKHPLLFYTTFTDKNGGIELSVPLPSSMTSGKYTVRIANVNGYHDKDFLFARQSDIKSVMLLLNDASSYEQAEDIITANYAKLALDPQAAAPYVSDLAKAYIDICSDITYTDEKIFYSDFMQCFAASQIKQGDDVREVLNNYKLYIGSEADQINTYPESVQTLLLEYVADSNFSDGLLSAQLPKLRVLAFFKSSRTSSMAKFNILGTDESGTEYINNFDVLNPDCTYYSKIRNVNLVYEKIYAQKDSITSFESLKTAFENASRNVYDDENKKVPVSGGGSSGGSAPSVTYVPDTTAKPQEPSSVFFDINNHWAKAQIELLASMGVISGYPDGSFKPLNNVTRAEFTKMITVFAGIENIDASVNFADVKESDWCYEYILKAFSGGLVNGISETEFKPESQISRQDVCVIISRYLGDKLSSSSELSYTDADEVSDYAANAVASLSAVGILTGYEDGSFKPQSPITRAETAVILSRVSDFIK
ncbi:MAG: S-layer homology domain-containing protein [Clostridia bacterium]|nr:S-layer homology domain-containing protein [Clostridia bacterium]